MAIHTEIYGTGQPIVLIHGWAMHSGIWRTFAKQLAQHHQVITVDLPGHGGSQKLTEFTLEQISQRIKSVLPAQNYTVLGWSLGAMVALDLASRFPDKISRLIIMAGNPCFVQDEDWAGMPTDILEKFSQNLAESCHSTLIRFLSLQVMNLPNQKILLSELKNAVQAYSPPESEVLRGGLSILRHQDLRPQLSRLHCPVAAILGELDTLVPVAVGEQMRAVQPRLSLYVLKRAGHLPFLSHQAEVIRLVNHFMESLPDGKIREG